MWRGRVRGGRGGIGVVRSFFRLPVSTEMSGATIIYSDLYTTDVRAATDCGSQPTDLWTTGPIRDNTDWNNQPAWESDIKEKFFAYGYSGCPVSKDNVIWTITPVIQDDVNNGIDDQTFGLQAPDETNMLQWKQFRSGSSNIHISTRYDLPPIAPDRTTSPGGSCYYSATGAPVIGNDDVTFYASLFDADGDNSLTAQFLVLNSNGKTVYDSQAEGTSVTSGDDTIASLTIPRSVIQQWCPNGTIRQYTYHWYAMITDSDNLTSRQPADNCYFGYNPLGPSAPKVSIPPAGANLGQTVSAKFSRCQLQRRHRAVDSQRHQQRHRHRVPVQGQQADPGRRFFGRRPRQRLATR